jgi:ferritin-like metal-binding protein YciE
MTTKTQSGVEERKSLTTEKNGNGAKKSTKDLHALLEAGLKDIYSAEKLLVNALPEIARAVDNEDLEEAITFHLQHPKKHVARLDKVFERLQITKTDSEKCAAMEGLIQEGRKVISEFERGPVRDSALIIGAQKIEHYEIAAYGSLCELADVLGENKIHDILGRTLDEEEETDLNLSDLAKDVNDEACELSDSRNQE